MLKRRPNRWWCGGPLVIPTGNLCNASPVDRESIAKTSCLLQGSQIPLPRSQDLNVPPANMPQKGAQRHMCLHETTSFTFVTTDSLRRADMHNKPLRPARNGMA